MLAWAGGVTVVLAIAGLAAYLGAAGLSQANELAGVAGGFVGLAGLGVAVYGVVQAHKDAVSSSSREPDDDQSVTDTRAAAVTQIKDVTGNVRVHGSTPAGRPASPRLSAAQPPMQPMAAPPAAAMSGGQAVTGSDIDGDVTQIDTAGGDVDLER